MSENESFDITIDGATDQPASNVLEKGRYVVEVIKIDPYQSKSGTGNAGIHVKFDVDGVHVDKWFVISDIDKKPHKMSYQWRQFLYSVGLRDKRSSWSIKSTDLMHKKCKADIIKKDDDNGTPKNEITFFSPIEEAEAPITGIPPEETSKKKEPPITVEAENTDDL